MTLPMQHIIQHLFRADSLEDVSRERLEELVSTYPSFSVGRYLLSRKLQTENAGHFSEETQKTNLYFTNPFWLQWLLQNEAVAQKPAYVRPVSPTPPAPAEETAGEAPAVTEEKVWQAQDVEEETAVSGEAAVAAETVGTGEPP